MGEVLCGYKIMQGIEDISKNKEKTLNIALGIWILFLFLSAVAFDSFEQEVDTVIFLLTACLSFYLAYLTNDIGRFRKKHGDYTEKDKAPLAFYFEVFCFIALGIFYICLLIYSLSMAP